MKKINYKFEETFKQNVRKDNLIDVVEMVLEIDFNSEHEAKLFYSVLSPEVSMKVSKGAESSIKLSGKRIFIFVQSTQLSKMRAIVNSYGRLINVVHNIVSVVEEVGK